LSGFVMQRVRLLAFHGGEALLDDSSLVA